MAIETIIAQYITRDPGIYRGKPIIRGTRIPVDLLIDFLANGASVEEIIDDYPELTSEAVEAAIAFTESEKANIEIRHWRI